VTAFRKSCTNGTTKQCWHCFATLPIEQFKICGKNEKREFTCLPCRLDRGWKAEQLRRQRRFRGVDIDAIHRNPRWIKLKAAA
jgi:hypothetical protein